jgi:hypothetical protein
MTITQAQHGQILNFIDERIFELQNAGETGKPLRQEKYKRTQLEKWWHALKVAREDESNPLPPVPADLREYVQAVLQGQNLADLFKGEATSSFEVAPLPVAPDKAPVESAKPPQSPVATVSDPRVIDMTISAPEVKKAISREQYELVCATLNAEKKTALERGDPQSSQIARERLDQLDKWWRTGKGRLENLTQELRRILWETLQLPEMKAEGETTKKKEVSVPLTLAIESSGNNVTLLNHANKTEQALTLIQPDMVLAEVKTLLELTAWRLNKVNDVRQCSLLWDYLLKAQTELLKLEQVFSETLPFQLQVNLQELESLKIRLFQREQDLDLIEQWLSECNRDFANRQPELMKRSLQQALEIYVRINSDETTLPPSFIAVQQRLAILRSQPALAVSPELVNTLEEPSQVTLPDLAPEPTSEENPNEAQVEALLQQLEVVDPQSPQRFELLEALLQLLPATRYAAEYSVYQMRLEQGRTEREEYRTDQEKMLQDFCADREWSEAWRTYRLLTSIGVLNPKLSKLEKELLKWNEKVQQTKATARTELRFGFNPVKLENLGVELQSFEIKDDAEVTNLIPQLATRSTELKEQTEAVAALVTEKAWLEAFQILDRLSENGVTKFFDGKEVQELNFLKKAYWLKHCDTQLTALLEQTNHSDDYATVKIFLEQGLLDFGQANLPVLEEVQARLNDLTSLIQQNEINQTILDNAQYDMLIIKINLQRDQYLNSGQEDKARELISLRKQLKSWFEHGAKQGELTVPLKELIKRYS